MENFTRPSKRVKRNLKEKNHRLEKIPKYRV